MVSLARLLWPGLVTSYRTQKDHAGVYHRVGLLQDAYTAAGIGLDRTPTPEYSPKSTPSLLIEIVYSSVVAIERPALSPIARKHGNTFIK